MGSPALLQEDLESELHRATPLEQADGLMQVDVMARCEHERALGVVPRTLEPFMTPLLDPVVLGDVQNLEFSRRHFVALPFPQWGIGVPRVFVQYDVPDVPFLGGFGSGSVKLQ